MKEYYIISVKGIFGTKTIPIMKSDLIHVLPKFFKTHKTVEVELVSDTEENFNYIFGVKSH